MDRLGVTDVVALSFMTFALFVGAGNIIFPPIVGLQAGENLIPAACGFLVTAVGLPVLTIVALSRVGGNMETLCSPLGRRLALLLSIICFLSVGPLFAVPRTATVSFEIGFLQFFEAGEQRQLAMRVYSVLYFVAVILISFYPKKILDIVGRVLAPIKILGLLILCVSVLWWTDGASMEATPAYQQSAFSLGIVNGYGTMDTLGALAFGVVIIEAIRSRGVSSQLALTRYAIYAALVAGLGLIFLYSCLFWLGHNSALLAQQIDDINGGRILGAYVYQVFGVFGSGFLSLLMLSVCLVTAIGLTCACGEFFGRYLPLSYRVVVLLTSLFSMVVANVGLSRLIAVSLPVLSAIYPPCIVVILCSFLVPGMYKPRFVVGTTAMVSLPFGCLEAMRVAGFLDGLKVRWLDAIPLMDLGLPWLLPACCTFFLAMLVDYFHFGRKEQSEG